MAHGCKGCRFWYKAEEQPAGFCRRYPPMWRSKSHGGDQGADDLGTPQSGDYGLPHTKADAWCGEWKDRDTSI
jgi:hypothetical protein